MPGTLSPEEIQYEQAHISDNAQPAIIAAISVSVAVAYVSVGLRFLSRWKSRSGLGWDDYLIVIGLIMATAANMSAGLMVYFGLGRHIIIVPSRQHFVQSVIATQVLYNATIPFVKISLLCLYARLFPSRILRRLSYGIGAFVTSYILVQAVCIITQCVPISSFWTGEAATCINFAVVLMICSILNIVTDIVILVLPVRKLRQNAMSASRYIAREPQCLVAWTSFSAPVSRA